MLLGLVEHRMIAWASLRAVQEFGEQSEVTMAPGRWLNAALGWGLSLSAASTAMAGPVSPPVAVGVRLTQDAAAASLSFELSRSVEAHAYTLASPDRIVVDLPAVNFHIDPTAGRVAGGNGAALVRAFRFGALSTGKSRVVIDLSRPACPGPIQSTPIVEGEPASRLTIELKPCDAGAFLALAPSLAASAENLASSRSPRPVVVLDPGHGGIDGGARGIGGVQEKALVWDFCRELKRQLEATDRYRVVMTREGDEYVGLDDRVAIAREAEAALFVSVHADTLGEAPDVGGSTVYTASERASDAEAARIAARENAADRGSKKEKGALDDPGVTDILFDLKRRETRAYAHMFSRGLVENLQSATRLNHNPERSARFVVLKAPEFPSVLVELGYLSNPLDVKSLSSPEWRAKAAKAALTAINAFFAAPGEPESKPGEAGIALEGRPALAAPDR